MLEISATDEWRGAHPGAAIGLLEISGVGSCTPTALDARKRAAEAALRERYKGYSRKDFTAHPVMAAYEKYYRRFSKTYHVLQQVESIVLKGRNLPNVSALVDANFAAEVVTWVLTAGHDCARLAGALSMDVARQGDEMTQMNGTRKPLLANDMIMRDANGVACSILYGQDNRSPISPQTSHVLYVAYAPPGVPGDCVEEQLREIEHNVRVVCGSGRTEQSRLLQA